MVYFRLTAYKRHLTVNPINDHKSVKFISQGHFISLNLIFDCLFELIPSRRKESGYSIIRYFASMAGVYGNTPFQGILGTDQKFLPPRPIQF